MNALPLALLLLLTTPADPVPDVCSQLTPEPRWGSVLVYDPLRDNVLLFGGGRDRRDFVGDTWTWDDGGWTRHDVAGPPARGFAGAAFEPASGTIVIHGGRGAGNATLGDSWSWDGSGWRLLAADGPALDHHRIAFSAVDGALFAFGGWDGSGVRSDSWLWDGAAWTRLEVDGPPPRSAFAMAFDDARGRLVVHGGLWIEGQYADAWEWDGSRWRAVWSPYANSSIDHHAMVFDRSRGRPIVFGGKNYRYRLLGRTLALGPEGFETLADDGPGARHSVGMTYDRKRGRTLLYGGKVYRGEDHLPLGDLWIFEGVEWRRWSAPEGAVADCARLESAPAIP